jgi:glycine betaine/choline ABC-type transport system substrate-binding protein
VPRAIATLVGVVALLVAAPASAQNPAPQVRLAAPSDCFSNPGCGPGLSRVYDLDVQSVFVPLTVADAGVGALDDGLAEVAVAFSTNPEVSRPDVVTLTDDRRMIGSDNIVPVVRSSLLRRYGRRARDIRRRLDAASAVLTTLALRGLNQQVIDGRLPEAVGGELIDANGLGGQPRRRHRGPLIVVGFMDFAENETLAWFYAEALRAGGYRVRVRPVGGLRPEAVRRMRRGRIGLWPGYGRSLLRFLGGTGSSTRAVRGPLRRELRPVGAEPLKLARAENRNLFVMKDATAQALGVTKLSDLARYWPAAP